MDAKQSCKNVIITGCSSGIGLSAANLLRQQGYQVFPTARDAIVVKQLRDQGFEAVQLDICNSQSINEAVDFMLTQTDSNIYALFNNCGNGVMGAIEDLENKSFSSQFATNVFGPIELTQKIIPVMRKQNYGKIIFVGSMLGYISMPYQGCYSASKHALESIVDTLAQELRKTNITVSIIEPGPIISSFMKNSLASFKLNADFHNSFHSIQYQLIVSFIENSMPCLFSHFVLPPDSVANKLLKILNKNCPKRRYYVTSPAYMIKLLKRFFPIRIIEKWLRKATNMEI